MLERGNATAGVKLTMHLMRNVLHCNRFQMVLETESDSEHQKKSVNLDLRTSLGCGKVTVRSVRGRVCFSFVILCRNLMLAPVRKYTSHPKNTDFKWC